MLNCAYAGQTLNQDAQYRRLTSLAEKTIRAGGVLLLPVPPTGRGCDMLLHLSAALPHVQIHAAKSILTNVYALLQNRKWLHSNLEGAATPDSVHALDNPEDYAAACAGSPCILLVTDGRLTTNNGQLCLHLLGQNPANRVVISGHAAPRHAGQQPA